MGVELWDINVSTPSLALPLHGGGNVFAKDFGFNTSTHYRLSSFSFRNLWLDECS